MKTLTMFRTASAAVFICALAALPTASWAKGPGGGGGPSKVEVTAAEPAEADQGQELDVFITGSGFDEGSTATWFVTGTSDDTQVQVLENEYLHSTGQLRARIRVNGTAIATDYDIEVRASSGRRGKGTTLFRVKSSNTNNGGSSCDAGDNLDPTIAYLTAFKSVSGINSADIMLSNDNGCQLTLLVEGAHQYVTSTSQDNDPGRFIQSVWKLSYSSRGNRGYVAWVDHYKTPDIVMGIGFSFDTNGEISLDTPTPEALYAPSGRTVDAVDVHLKWNSESGTYDAFLAMIEYSETDGYDRLLSILNVPTGNYQVISEGPCHMTDAGGCWHPSWWEIRWSPNGEEIYYALHDSWTEYFLDGIGRSRLVDGLWTSPELVVVRGPDDTYVHFQTVSSSGLVVYSVEEPTYHPKNGRPRGVGIVDRMLDLNADACGSPDPCLASDGIEVPKGLYGANRLMIWTRNHRLIFPAVGSQDYVIEEIVDPLTGEKGPLSIKNVENEVDTSE